MVKEDHSKMKIFGNHAFSVPDFKKRFNLRISLPAIEDFVRRGTYKSFKEIFLDDVKRLPQQ